MSKVVPNRLNKGVLTSVKARPLVVGLGSAVMVAFVTSFMPNYYRSDMKILPVDTKASGSLSQLAGAAAAFGVGLPGQDSGDANYADIISSHRVYNALLDHSFEFHQAAWRFGKPKLQKKTLRDYLNAGNDDRARRELGKLLTAVRDSKSRVLAISAETQSPELSQQIVRQAAKVLENFLLEKGRTRGGAKALFSEARLKEARGEYDMEEGLFRDFLMSNRAFRSSNDPSIQLKGGRLEAELKLKQQLVLTLAMNREQALMEEKNDVPILNVLDDGSLPIEKSRPFRTQVILAACFLATLGTWLWIHRKQVIVNLFTNNSPSETWHDASK
jgi:uncharacterized protein involved in exopolysaccharide biosynthesis